MKKYLCFLLIVLALSVPFSVHAETEEQVFDSIKNVLETMFKDTYYASIECNKSGVIIKTADQGVAAGLLSVELGLSDYEVWESLRSITVDFANSIYFFLKECGVKEPNLLFIMVDDWSKETTFLAVYNGEIIYDFLPNK